MQDLVGGVVGGGAPGDANAGADVDLVAVDEEGRSERLLDAVGDGGGLADCAQVIEEDGELVAAEPGQGHRVVARFGAGCRCGCRWRSGRSAAERRAAIWMMRSSPAWWPRLSLTSLKRSRSMKRTAKHGLGLAAVAGDGAGEAIEEEAAVGQLGQGVMGGVVDELIFGAFALDDAAELGADLAHEMEQKVVGRGRTVGEELEDGDDLGRRRGRERHRRSGCRCCAQLRRGGSCCPGRCLRSRRVLRRRARVRAGRWRGRS